MNHNTTDAKKALTARGFGTFKRWSKENRKAAAAYAAMTAAYAAARIAMRKRSAEIVRRHYPEFPGFANATLSHGPSGPLAGAPGSASETE